MCLVHSLNLQCFQFQTVSNQNKPFNRPITLSSEIDAERAKEKKREELRKQEEERKIEQEMQKQETEKKEKAKFEEIVLKLQRLDAEQAEKNKKQKKDSR